LAEAGAADTRGKDTPSTLAEEVGRLLSRHGLKLAVAESCTGGLLAHTITNVPGSSAYFVAGLVTYSNEAKHALLGVKKATLADHGAVSVETAKEMAAGARKKTGADVSLATTGIAGPGGGSTEGSDSAEPSNGRGRRTAEKPVGLVYIAISSREGTLVEKNVWAGSREGNKTSSVDAALTLLKNYLYGLGE